MYDFSKLRQAHLEITGKCNARCPMCSRYTKDGNLVNFPQTHLSKEHFYKFFSPELCSQLDHVYFSGIYGDPCIHPDLIEFVSFIIKNIGHVNVDTNAGYRTTKFWHGLAKTGVHINFAIDGLKDTNHIYRRNVRWDKVEENIRAYSDAGGKAMWNFIVFKHNEHQVEEAKEFAESLGFDFRIKITGKFKHSPTWVVHENGNPLYNLEPPTINEYRHQMIGTQPFSTIEAPYKKVIVKSDEWSEVDIDCESLDKQEIFLNYEGYVLPCCYLGTLYGNTIRDDINTKLNLQDYSLNNYTTLQIIDNMSKIAKTWEAKNCRTGKLMACAHTCGKNQKRITQFKTFDS